MLRRSSALVVIALSGLSGCSGGREAPAGIALPVQVGQPGPREAMQALLEGTLVEEAGCIYISPSDSTRYLPIWPPGFSLTRSANVLHVRNDAEATVARVGEVIRVDGGELPGVPVHAIDLASGSVDGCNATLWMIGNQVGPAPSA